MTQPALRMTEHEERMATPGERTMRLGTTHTGTVDDA